MIYIYFNVINKSLVLSSLTELLVISIIDFTSFFIRNYNFRYTW